MVEAVKATITVLAPAEELFLCQSMMKEEGLKLQHIPPAYRSLLLLGQCSSGSIHLTFTVCVLGTSGDTRRGGPDHLHLWGTLSFPHRDKAIE